MASRARALRIMQDERLLLFDAHERVLEEQQGRAFTQSVLEIRDLAHRLRHRYAAADEKRLTRRLRQMSVSELVDVGRAFTILFWLWNVVEERQAERQRARDERGTFRSLFARLRGAGIDGEEVAAAIERLRATVVLTAHPTEALRWSLRETLDRIDALLDRRETEARSRRPWLEKQVLAEITGLWLSTPLRTRKPTPLDEVRYATHVMQEVLVFAVPTVTDRLVASFHESYPEEAPRGGAAIEHAAHRSLRVGSWMGGDRDGNPFVTAEVTSRALRLYRQAILQHYADRIQPLIERLTLSSERAPTSSALEASIERDLAELDDLAERIAGRNLSERYRLKLNAIALRLELTIEAERAGRPREERGGYANALALKQDLERIRESLVENGAERLVHGPLRSLIDSIDVFGFDLVTLDIRQNQSKHRQARAELICPVEGPLESLPLSRQQAFLEEVILAREPVATPHAELSEDAREVMATLAMVAALPIPPEGRSVRDLVISDTQNAIPVLELLALCRQVGLVRLHAETGFESEVDIVPLFESVESLQGATASMDRLYRSAAYRHQLEARGMRQQIMLGYSDSMKDGGYLAACGALEQAQRELAAQARAEGVHLEFFHGRGGTIARGGGPTHRAILAQPRGTVDGRLKLTEQGEVISTKYGTRNAAAYHLELILAATLEATLGSRDELLAKEPATVWRETLRTLARESRAAYRDLVYETPGFVDVFHAMTPIEEVSALNLGSRPARRTSTRAIENLRAIPWTFSWNQTRILLPSWYGVGTGFAAFCESHPGGHDKAMGRLRTMYRRWPYFRELIDNLEQVLVKVDLHVAARYAELARATEGASEVFLRIEKECQRTLRAVRDVSGDRVLLARDPALREALDRRTPPLDVLSYLQVELLDRKRSRRGLGSEAGDLERVEQAIQLTINGVAAGLRNTG